MAIQIHRGILGSHSPLMLFTGSASDGTTSTNGANRINGISAQYNTDDADYVDIVDDSLTTSNNHTTYDVYYISYKM